MEQKQWTVDNIPNQSGRTFLITGAASGLGFMTALELARRGAHVIMTARDQARGAAARGLIRSQVRRARVELRLLDLADLNMVKSFAAQLNTERQPIDVLVNSAAVMMPPLSFSRQGLELQFGVNHIAHFALTLLLLDRLKTSHAARVVTTTCKEYERGAIQFDNLAGTKEYSRRGFYAQSKLANALFSVELDRRLKRVGILVKSVAALPAPSATNLQRSGPTGLLYLSLLIGNQFMAHSAARGALSLLYAATAPGVESGQFVGCNGDEINCPAVVQPAKAALDASLAERLWKVSERLAGVHSLVLNPQSRSHTRLISAPPFNRSRQVAQSAA